MFSKSGSLNLRLTKYLCKDLQVLAHLGCYNKWPQTVWMRNSRIYFWHFWRLSSPRSECQHGLGKQLSHEGRVLMKGICSLRKETPKNPLPHPPPPPPPCEVTMRRQPSTNRAFVRHQICQQLDLGTSQPTELWEMNAGGCSYGIFVTSSPNELKQYFSNVLGS